VDIDAYERRGWADYDDLAKTIAEILNSAVRRQPALRLQQVKHRAKGPDSLRKKLIDRSISDATDLEDRIKDLAGCRLIFYTNSDVAAFQNSGLLHDNFDVLNVNVHYPTRESASELFISNNYLVALKADRLALPEYARFANMRCEVQVQTILNHAWAEMAHDTIYKRPELNGFGEKALAAIERRLNKVMREHLLPAGYDFQKIASDFDRLRTGKELFDEKPLETIRKASNSNDLHEEIERYAEHVLPLYDDISAEYRDIVAALVDAVKRARSMPVMQIETPYGSFDGRSSTDVARVALGILEARRFTDIDVTLDALFDLYEEAESADEKKLIEELGMKLAEHNLHVWRQHGPALQYHVSDRLNAVPRDQRHQMRGLLTKMLGKILESEVSGVTSSADSVTIHQGAVQVSAPLSRARLMAMLMLAQLLEDATNDEQRRETIAALFDASRTPYTANYSDELALMVARHTRLAIRICRARAGAWSFELLQAMESRLLHIHYRYRTLPPIWESNEPMQRGYGALVAEILVFRDQINADPAYVNYKILVGYDTVRPEAWTGDAFDYQATEVWRQERIAAMVEEVGPANSVEWLNTIERCAQTRSNDLATFPSFADFLARLGEARPAIVKQYLQTMSADLSRFVTPMLRGLDQAGEHPHVAALIADWVAEGRLLSDLAFYLERGAFDLEQLKQILLIALAREDDDGVFACLSCAVRRFETDPVQLIDDIFLPSIEHFAAKGHTRWATHTWLPWMNAPILRDLTEDQAARVLQCLLDVPDIDYRVEFILVPIARNHAKLVIAFFGDRLRRPEDEIPAGYRALPFSVKELREPLAPHAAELIQAAHEWEEFNPPLFGLMVGRFLSSVFPDISGDFAQELEGMIAAGGAQTALGILENYEGSSATHPLCKLIVETLEPGDKLLSRVKIALTSTGVVRGEYGFADAYEAQKASLREWLDDARPKVASFASELIRSLDQSIADEHRRADESREGRLRRYGEDGESAE
jgi:ppGpp synthetase/RelA/SpoT-type nucleotidyltranferase